MGADAFHSAVVPTIVMNEPLTTTDIDGAMTAMVAFQVAADRTEVAVHQREIPDAVPDDAEGSLTDPLWDLADIEEA